MRCLKMVNLSRNGLGEECAEEIEVLLGIKRITRVDLSRNEMGKTCLQIITKNFNHLEWVE
jgi:Ran GTPase-activating protein (RanGAP) involved in mRNA processing and transport